MHWHWKKFSYQSSDCQIQTLNFKGQSSWKNLPSFFKLMQKFSCRDTFDRQGMSNRSIRWGRSPISTEPVVVNQVPPHRSPSLQVSPVAISLQRNLTALPTLPLTNAVMLLRMGSHFRMRPLFPLRVKPHLLRPIQQIVRRPVPSSASSLPCQSRVTWWGSCTLSIW